MWVPVLICDSVDLVLSKAILLCFHMKSELFFEHWFQYLEQNPKHLQLSTMQNIHIHWISSFTKPFQLIEMHYRNGKKRMLEYLVVQSEI